MEGTCGHRSCGRCRSPLLWHGQEAAKHDGRVRTFTKTGPPEALRYEAAGLRWLAEAGGARVVTVIGQRDGTLETEHLAAATPDPAAAEELGRGLARTHAAGAPAFGAPPEGWSGDGWMGHAPLPLGGDPARRWGQFYAEDRLLPYLRQARANGSVDAAGARVIERCAARLADGDLDAPQPALVRAPAARLHGDLWGGNVMWAPSDGGVVAVLIDPAAQGGHAESDLAQLAVFGAPHRGRIVAAYDEVSPLADGWPERVALHQLHMLIVHAALFGGGYGAQTVAAAGRYV